MVEKQSELSDPTFAFLDHDPLKCRIRHLHFWTTSRIRHLHFWTMSVAKVVVQKCTEMSDPTIPVAFRPPAKCMEPCKRRVALFDHDLSYTHGSKPPNGEIHGTMQTNAFLCNSWFKTTSASWPFLTMSVAKVVVRHREKN